MRKKEPISKIMTTDLITLSFSDTLYSAEKRMKVNHIRHIPVVEGEKLLGLLSLSDLKRISFIDAYSKEGTEDTPVYNMLSINDIMIKSPIITTSDTSILDVSKLLVNEQFHSLPVVDRGKLVGIITTTDILNFFIDFC
ncbi:CBS domain-containing protein [Flavobacteriaceae bacterium AH-315-O20]|nr:CBS domain-containing protein [Flavobacteriaceae bacterium AH-315-O20]